MDILSKLIRSGDADLLSSDFDDCIFATPLQYLVLPDIELIISSLELLYRLSAHQQYCDHIAFLHNALGLIDCLFCVFKQSLGCSLLNHFTHAY